MLISIILTLLLDNYINVDTLTMLSHRSTKVSATIYTRQLSQQQQLAVQRHNQQYPPIAINVCQKINISRRETNSCVFHRY